MRVWRYVVRNETIQFRDRSVHADVGTNSRYRVPPAGITDPHGHLGLANLWIRAQYAIHLHVLYVYPYVHALRNYSAINICGKVKATYSLI